MAPRNIYTQSHPDPNAPKVVNNPARLIRKKIFIESQASNYPLPRSNSLLESFITVEDIEFYLPFDHSLFRNKSESFAPKTVFDESILKPHILAHKLVILDSDKDVVQQF